MTIYLKFPDEATAQLVMSDYYDDKFGWKTSSLDHELDPIGVLWNNDAVFDNEECIQEPTQKVGWFINFIGELPDAAKPYVLKSITPDSVFAN